jgi:hypothetical protein
MLSLEEWAAVCGVGDGLAEMGGAEEHKKKNGLVVKMKFLEKLENRAGG